jgi:NADH:ubiquinone oxidoreductase subunit K
MNKLHNVYSATDYIDIVYSSYGLIAPVLPDSNSYAGAGVLIGCLLFFIGLAGMAFNYKNFLVTMLCVESMYLGIVTCFVFQGLIHADATAAIYGLLVLIFAACESAVGLGLLVTLYRFGRTVGFDALTSLGG